MGNTSSMKNNNADITTQIYKQVNEKENGNFAFSPLSIQIVVCMLTMGADGPSKDQLYNFVGVRRDKEFEELVASIGTALSDLDNEKDTTIDLANIAFVQQDCELKEDYKKKLKKHLAAKIKSLDFDNYKKAADLINGYISSKTHDKIQQVVVAEELQGAVMVLVNALYFKANWRNPFDVDKTKKDMFYVSKDMRVPADFMHKTGNVLIGRHKGRITVALPYEGNRFVMYLLLPQHHSSSETVSAEDILWYCDIRHYYQEVADLLVPKFETQYHLDLVPIMKKFGVHDVFDYEVANLTKITDCKDPQNLSVARSEHQVYVKVNEKGTEAAAVTTATISVRRKFS